MQTRTLGDSDLAITVAAAAQLVLSAADLEILAADPA
jgi:hypothetical protein